VRGWRDAERVGVMSRELGERARLPADEDADTVGRVLESAVADEPENEAAIVDAALAPGPRYGPSYQTMDQPERK
jgi:hypothetical protein